MKATTLSVRANKLIIVIPFTLINIGAIPLKAQTGEPPSPFKVTADLVSHYVWRGSLATGNTAPNFQPTLAIVKGNFEIGVWGSTDFVGSYQEVDPYVTMTTGHIETWIYRL